MSNVNCLFFNVTVIPMVGSMDEIARRREARRRKILENSQDRFQRITGIEQKSSRVHLCENETRSSEERPSEYLTNENNQVQPQHNNTELRKQPQKQYRTTVIIALAVFVNYNLLILEKFYKVDLNSSHLNKIFIPVLAYEVIQFFSAEKYRRDNKNFLYLLLVANAKNSHILPLIKHIELITNVLQDVMIYFFVYVCCDVVKYSMWLLS